MQRRPLAQRLWVTRRHGELARRFDSESQSQAWHGEQWRDGWTTWLRGYRWDWWVTFTWRNGVSRAPRAQRALAGDARDADVQRYRAEKARRARGGRAAPKRTARGAGGPGDAIEAMADVETWLRKLRAVAPGAAAAVSIERGKVTDRLHAHALVFTGGGLAAERLRDEWWRWGQMRVEPFRPFRVSSTSKPHGGAAWYAVKAPANVELHGLPPAYRPRRRR